MNSIEISQKTINSQYYFLKHFNIFSHQRNAHKIFEVPFYHRKQITNSEEDVRKHKSLVGM